MKLFIKLDDYMTYVTSDYLVGLLFRILFYVGVHESKKVHPLLSTPSVFQPLHYLVHCLSGIYRVGQKSKPRLSTHNFVKYWPIFKILSLSHCPGNLQ